MFRSLHNPSAHLLMLFLWMLPLLLHGGSGCRSDGSHPDEPVEPVEAAAITADTTTTPADQPDPSHTIVIPLEGAPRHDLTVTNLGTVVVNTQPAHALVEIDGYPRYIRHPSYTGAVREIRTPVTLDGLPIDQPIPVTVSLPGFLAVQLTLPPIDEVGTQWVESEDDGYLLELNIPLEAVEGEAIELRADPDDVPQVFAEVMIQTNPSGARISYQGRIVVDHEGHPLRTPTSFSEVAQYAVHDADPEGHVAQENLSWVPVGLSRQGVPIQIELDGYAPIIIGLYHLMFRCDPVATVSEDAPYWERCQYRYNTGLLDLLTVDEATHLP